MLYRGSLLVQTLSQERKPILSQNRKPLVMLIHLASQVSSGDERWKHRDTGTNHTFRSVKVHRAENRFSEAFEPDKTRLRRKAQKDFRMSAMRYRQS